jgi:hypothetical protein
MSALGLYQNKTNPNNAQAYDQAASTVNTMIKLEKAKPVN